MTTLPLNEKWEVWYADAATKKDVIGIRSVVPRKMKLGVNDITVHDSCCYNHGRDFVEHIVKLHNDSLGVPVPGPYANAMEDHLKKMADKSQPIPDYSQAILGDKPFLLDEEPDPKWVAKKEPALPSNAKAVLGAELEWEKRVALAMPDLPVVIGESE